MASAGLAILGLFAGLFLAQRKGCNVGGLFGPCQFKQVYQLPCPTCGMTTSVLAFTRLDLVRSFEVQPAAALLCGVLIPAASFLVGMAVCGRVPWFLSRVWRRMGVKGLLIGVGLILATGWAVTLGRAISD